MCLQNEPLLLVVLHQGVGPAVMDAAFALAPTIQGRPDFRVVELLNVLPDGILLQLLHIHR